jgi:dephospho-CoA kinase
MNLVYIYGPPATGKLTVANALAAQTGYKVFHNHLSIDCIRPVFDFGTESFWRLVHQIRLMTIEESARSGTDLIYTSVYSHPNNQALLEAGWTRWRGTAAASAWCSSSARTPHASPG